MTISAILVTSGLASGSMRFVLETIGLSRYRYRPNGMFSGTILSGLGSIEQTRKPASVLYVSLCMSVMKTWDAWAQDCMPGFREQFSVAVGLPKEHQAGLRFWAMSSRRSPRSGRRSPLEKDAAWLTEQSQGAHSDIYAVLHEDAFLCRHDS